MTAVRIHHTTFADLDPAEADRLFDELTELVGSSLTPGVAADDSWAVADWTARRNRIAATASVYVARADDAAVGFLAYVPEVMLGHPVVTLLVGCIDPAWQSKGIAFTFNLRLLLRTWRRNRLRPTFLVARVLNPKALHGWRRQLHDHRYFWPRIGDAPQPVVQLDRIVAEYVRRHEHDVKFDRDGSVLKARHLPGRRTTERSGNADVDDHYDRHVDLEAGDTVLMAIYIDRSLIRSHVRRLATVLPRVVRIRSGSQAGTE